MVTYGICIFTTTYTIIILGLVQTVDAQSDDFKIYTSKELGFTIEHPAKWKVEEYPEDNPTEVYFTIRENKDVMNNEYLPESIYNSDFTISVEEPKSDLNTETMTIINETLAERVQEELDKYTGSSKSKLIRQNAVTVGGNEGWKIESRNSDTYLNYDRYNFKIIINANGKFYILRYTEVPLKVPETLPLADKMVESFKVNTEEDTSNNSHFEKENENPSNNLTYEEFEKKYCAPTTLLLCRAPSEPEEPQDDRN